MNIVGVLEWFMAFRKQNQQAFYQFAFMRQK